MPKVRLQKSDKPEKKWKMIIEYSEGQRLKTIHFGQKGADDYTKGATDQQRKNYRSRHQKEKNQNWDTAGQMSLMILWGNSRNLKTNFNAYKNKYNLKSF